MIPSPLVYDMIFEYKKYTIPLTDGVGDDTMILREDCIILAPVPGIESM